jgi:hypothetical protein
MNLRTIVTGSVLRFVVIFCIIAACMYPVTAATTDDTATSNAGEEIAVSSITITPEILMSDDTATIVVKVTNNGGESVGINRAELYSSDLEVLNYQTYDKVGNLGPDISMDFTFTVRADAGDGVYFPTFYLDFQDAGSMRYPIPVQIENTDIRFSVIDAPDTYAKGDTNEVTLAVFNPRDNAVNGVSVTVSGNGVTSKQTAIFLGTLDVDETQNVTFEVTPEQSTDLTFTVSYRNGMNTHTSTLVVPMTVGARSTQAELVVNSIELTSSGGTYTVEGDVTNAGLEDAKSIVVTVGSPATAVDPTKVYVIGSLEPDDFSTFEVTFTAQGSATIPLTITYKDEDGNSFQTSEQISLGQTGSSGSTAAAASGNQQMTGPGQRGMFGMSGGGLGSIPIVPIIVVIGAGIALVVLWRKGVLGKVRARLRK